MITILTRNLKNILIGIVVLIALLGLFDQQAHHFVSTAAKKNIAFLALISEIKLMMTSIKGIGIPFISGSTDAIDTSLGKAQNYLLMTNIITFMQLLLLGISKSWLIKVGVVLLFGWTLYRKTDVFSRKLLILVLALNPGFSIYSVVVQQVAAHSSVDFGNQYLTELKAKADKIKQEKSKLMQEHAQQINRINNGEKGIVFLKKLKEDVSYDLKKGVDDIKGEYAEIRLLIHEAGHTMVKKLFTFATMIVFYFFLLPIGYLLLINFLVKSLGLLPAGFIANSSQTGSYLQLPSVLSEASEKLEHLKEKTVTSIKSKLEKVEETVTGSQLPAKQEPTTAPDLSKSEPADPPPHDESITGSAEATSVNTSLSDQTSVTHQVANTVKVPEENVANNTNDEARPEKKKDFSLSL